MMQPRVQCFSVAVLNQPWCTSGNPQTFTFYLITKVRYKTFTYNSFLKSERSKLNERCELSFNIYEWRPNSV